jgi:hypothetical protein
LNGDNCQLCQRKRALASQKPVRFSKKRLAIIALLLLVLLPGTAYALTSLGSQVLPRPNAVHASIVFSCSSPSLVNVTSPNPLRTGFATGNNGTALFGCSLSSGRVSPAFQVVTAGTVNATLNLPLNVSLFLISNPSTLGPLSQAQCSTGIQLVAGRAISLPLGSYSYCESFLDAGSLVTVTTAWFQL